jgi:hypothetical protein
MFVWYVALLSFHNVKEQQRLLAVNVLHAKSNPKQTWPDIVLTDNHYLKSAIKGITVFTTKSPTN